MKNRKIISLLTLFIALLAVIAATSGVFSNSGNGEFEYQSIRGKTISIFGKGVYQHMSSEVAIQGIAQDYVTLFIAIPLLLVSLFRARTNSLKGRFFLAGILNYFLVTYLFYMNMAMYNILFLVYIVLTGMSFFAFVLTLLSIGTDKLPDLFKKTVPVKFIGSFLIANSILIGLLWLSVIIPPLIDKSVYPQSVHHYTTLTVQGFDLSLFLPISFVGGFLLIKRRKFGYLMATVTLVFLPLLMIALIAKIIAMALAGINVIPVIIIIPVIAIISAYCGFILVRDIIET